MDSITGHLPVDGPILIVTASFEGIINLVTLRYFQGFRELHYFTGQPADNAARFMDWLSNLQGEELKGVRFAIFGCGNSDWVQTYQRIPKLCDELIEKRGGQRLLPSGSGDASQGSFFGVFEEFEAKFWETLSKVCFFR